MGSFPVQASAVPDSCPPRRCASARRTPAPHCHPLPWHGTPYVLVLAFTAPWWLSLEGRLQEEEVGKARLAHGFSEQPVVGAAHGWRDGVSSVPWDSAGSEQEVSTRSFPVQTLLRHQPMPASLDEGKAHPLWNLRPLPQPPSQSPVHLLG
ncbi:hypothetical protein P7K49_033069 [Saguinus oedipus]|uniref:Uncharacterized protein n=1 Tax=Saguinus oedipus TaxID=9490 RepID=A0ABQ9TQW1_SAGOE|nr:hypothetical protein P7K49_033069 [Saguinus oedipus]